LRRQAAKRAEAVGADDLLLDSDGERMASLVIETKWLGDDRVIPTPSAHGQGQVHSGLLPAASWCKHRIRKQAMQAFKLQHFAAAHPQEAFPSFTTITSQEIERLREHLCQAAGTGAATDWAICTGTCCIRLSASGPRTPNMSLGSTWTRC
jgi:hypothetical protein